MSTQSTVSTRITGDFSGLNAAVDAAQASLRKLDGQAQATGAAAKGMEAVERFQPPFWGRKEAPFEGFSSSETL